MSTASLLTYIVSQTFGVKFFAMEFPDVQDVPLRLRRGDQLTEFAAIATRFLDDFLRGNRDDTPRSGEGGIMQALQLMNSELVVGRVAAEESILSALLDEQPDDTLVYLLYILALSRPPSEQELVQARISDLAPLTARAYTLTRRSATISSPGRERRLRRHRSSPLLAPHGG